MRGELLAQPRLRSSLAVPRPHGPGRRGAPPPPRRLAPGRRAFAARRRSAVSRRGGLSRPHPVRGKPRGRGRRLSARPARHVRLRLSRRAHARARRRLPAAGPRRRRLPPRLPPRHRPRARRGPALGRHRPLGLAHPLRRDPVGARARPGPARGDRPARRLAARRGDRPLDAAADGFLLRLRQQPAGPLVDRPPAREPPALARVREPDRARAGARPRGARLLVPRVRDGRPGPSRPRRLPVGCGAVLQGLPRRPPPARPGRRVVAGPVRPEAGALPRRLCPAPSRPRRWRWAREATR